MTLDGDEPEPTRRRRVPVDWDGLELALTWRSEELEYFLDLRTGQVRQRQQFPFGGEREDFELSDDELDEGDFVRVDPLESSVEYGWMAEFAESIGDPRLRELLDVALGGRGAFRRFKDVLARYPRERERWFRVRDERVQEAMREWLEDNGIEPTTEPLERPPG